MGVDEMMEPQTVRFTQLLLEVSKGDRNAAEELLPLIYDELRRLAAGYLRRERSNHTLDATAVVHEAYLRLVDQTRVEWQNRAQFLGVAASLMRRILVDHARTNGAEKRGRGFEKISLEDGLVASNERSRELVAVDEALETLAQVDPLKSRVVELRFFGGLSVEETAEVLNSSTATVNRQWRMAKAWLYGQLRNGA